MIDSGSEEDILRMRSMPSYRRVRFGGSGIVPRVHSLSGRAYTYYLWSLEWEIH